MQVNVSEKLERIHVILEKGVDFDEGDLERKYQTSLGHRRFTKKFIEEFPKTVGYDEITKIGMCSEDHIFVNATLIRYLQEG